MALNKEERKKLDDTHDAVLTLKTVLLGKDSDNGLVGDVKRNSRNIMKLSIAAAILAATLGGSAAGILKLLGGLL